MPSRSVAQQRLMGQAYALKKGDISLKDLDPNYRDEIKSLADNMTMKQLKDFAETKHKGLPAKIGESMKHIKNFESFIHESLNESHFKVGDKVECIKSGMTGKVIGLDKEDGAEDEKYYTVKREDGEEIKYSPAELKLVESKINEEYVELAGFDTYTEKLINEFKDWYKGTANNWEDFKDNMAEDSVDEAAKNAQMEILAYLSNEMNNVIKDRKFKVRMDLK